MFHNAYTNFLHFQSIWLITLCAINPAYVIHPVEIIYAMSFIHLRFLRHPYKTPTNTTSHQQKGQIVAFDQYTQYNTFVYRRTCAAGLHSRLSLYNRIYNALTRPPSPYNRVHLRGPEYKLTSFLQPLAATAVLPHRIQAIFNCECNTQRALQTPILRVHEKPASPTNT